MTAAAPKHAERAVAMINYGLFIAAPFTLGALALGAVLVAYARKGRADPVTKSHYERQIRAFWIDLVQVVLGFVCGWAAVAGGIGTLFAATGVGRASLNEGRLEIWTLVFAVLWAILWLKGFGGLMLGSLIGAYRLASGQPARKTRSP
jgi:uncharacterized membrane protein